MAVHMTLTDIEEYSLRLNNVLDCTIYNQITVGNVTLPKAVLSVGRSKMAPKNRISYVDGPLFSLVRASSEREMVTSNFLHEYSDLKEPTLTSFFSCLSARAIEPKNV